MTIKLKSIQKSNKAGKKMMAVFEVNGREKTVHFGSSANKDFTIYSKTEGKEKAEKMRNAYIARHRVNENWNDPTSAGALSYHILWSFPTKTEAIKKFKEKFNL